MLGAGRLVHVDAMVPLTSSAMRRFAFVAAAHASNPSDVMPRSRPRPTKLPLHPRLPCLATEANREVNETTKGPRNEPPVQGSSRRPSDWSWSPQRRFSSSSGSDREAATAFVIERGYSEELARGIVSALEAPGSGVPDGMLLVMVTQMAGRWEVGEDAGLEALAKSVEQDLAKRSGKQLVRFTVQPPGGGLPFDCEGYEGMSLKDVAEHGESPGAQLLGEYLECACSGQMACSTCHVYVDPVWFHSLGAPIDAEQDMIELAHEPRETSRLGCQVKLSPALEGLRIEMPSGANNMFDHIPFE